MRKLIIGCGYLGSRVARIWHNAGHEVLALTRSPERTQLFQSQGWTPLLGDITSPQNFPTLPAADVILYAVGYDASAGKERRAVTIDGLRHVLEQTRHRTGKLIFISSTSVYGQTDGSWIDENSPCEPSRENGKLCLEAEQLVRSLAPSQHAILRLSGIYGPARLLARKQMLLDAKPLSGNPDAWLNLIHVDDAASAILAAESTRLAGETFLISDDQPIPRREYYSQLARLINAPDPTYAPLDPHGPESHSLNKRCRNTRLHTQLSLTLTYPTINAGLPHALTQSLS